MTSPITINTKQELHAVRDALQSTCDQLGIRLGKGTQTADAITARIFGFKDYNRALASLPTAKPTPAKGHHSVLILNYGSQSILVVDEEYISATNEGTDLEIPYSVLESQAYHYAKTLGIDVQCIDLPEILGNDYSSDNEIVELASSMGYGKAHNSIFTCLETMAGVSINDKLFDNTGIDSGNWDSLPDDECPDGVCVWMPELRTIEGTYEYYFSFGELCRATTTDGKTWKIPYGRDPHSKREVFCNVTFMF